MAFIIFRVVLLGVFGGTAASVLWVMFFTYVLPWPGNDMFATVAFLLGALGSIALGLRWATG